MWSAFVPRRLGVTAKWRVFFDFLMDSTFSLTGLLPMLLVASGCCEKPLLQHGRAVRRERASVIKVPKVIRHALSLKALP